MNNNLFILILTLLLVLSCNKPPNNPEKQEAAIYSLLIDKMAKPLPPPPPPPKDGSKPKSINFDSINKVKMEIVVDTMMFNTSNTLDLQEEFSEFQMLVDSISSLPVKPVKKEYLKSEKGHTLIFGRSLEDSDTQYSQMLGISPIAFNQQNNKAAVYAGHSTHPLASYLKLYLLKKINEKWQIVFEKTIEVS
ncbi:hypothetical protein FHG64_08020 [Antarcticibacterium flavum]|uniref:Uncharacterized protein n=1 Tax=Antarcticibacterium flavum TaxID=2058175 RepID=A0A5B7X3Z9_9FLAO|nr:MULTISPECIES: hypothetical protein [Antarcticibacterium]MCM4161846.1 hypothetical protein [Antarcticibacterium sp. W02-3]QCY69343.1 hypothetical protein FHG64_08020 [Antarcticibacterium flavum]